MSQVKIYGLRSHLRRNTTRISDVVHSCVVDALAYPQDKRAHRFFLLEADEFFYPAGRTERYTILEFSMFEGRTVEAKKKLIRLVFERMEAELGIRANRCGGHHLRDAETQLGLSRQTRRRA